MTADNPVPDVSIVIVTWNGWNLLRRCLRSVLETEATRYPTEIIVVDSGSTDNTADELSREFPQVRCLQLKDNAGFAVANNRGAELANAKLIFLLNNDTVLQPGAVDKLVETARDFPDFHIFAPQMLRLANPAFVDNRGVYVDVTGHCRQLDSGAPTSRNRPRSEIFGASAGACIVRRGVIRSIGLFDESLGSYQEDCDFAFRARAHGYRCLYEPLARVLHEGSATADRIPEQKFYQIQRNMRVVRSRWLPDRPWDLRALLGVAYRGLHIAKALLRGRLLTILRARRDAQTFPAAQQAGTVRYSEETRCRQIQSWIGVRGRPVEPPRG